MQPFIARRSFSGHFRAALWIFPAASAILKKRMVRGARPGSVKSDPINFS